MKNWSLEPEQFADLAASLSQFFQQTGLLQQSGMGLGNMSPGKWIIFRVLKGEILSNLTKLGFSKAGKLARSHT